MVIPLLAAASVGLLCSSHEVRGWLKAARASRLERALLVLLMLATFFLSHSREPDGELLDSLRVARVVSFLLLGVLAFFAWIGLIGRTIPETALPASLWAMLAYGGFATFTSLYSLAPGLSLWKGYEVLVHALVAAALARKTRDERDALRLYGVAVIVLSFLLFCYLWSILLFPTAAYGLTSSREPGLGRFAGIFPQMNSNDAGGIAATIAVISIIYLGQAKKNATKWPFLLLLATSLVALYLAHSRNAVIGLVAGHAILAIFARNRIAALLLGFLGASLLVSELAQHLNDYMLRGQTESEFARLTGRIAIWKNAFNYISIKPFFGYGFYTFRNTIAFSHAHNSYLSVLLGGGAFLLIILFGAILALLIQLARSWRQARSELALLVWSQSAAIFAVIFVRSLTELSFEVHHINLTLFCLCAIGPFAISRRKLPQFARRRAVPV